MQVEKNKFCVYYGLETIPINQILLGITGKGKGKESKAVREGENGTNAEKAWQHINITTYLGLHQQSAAAERAHLSNPLLSIKYAFCYFPSVLQLHVWGADRQGHDGKSATDV